MKKLITTISFILIVLILLSPIATLAADLDLVIDEANLLTEGEYLDLYDRAEKVSEKYQIDISLIIMDDMGYGDAFDFADEIRTEYDLGQGEDKSLLLLFLSMADRDYALLAHGYGNTAFTDHGKDVILDKHVLPLLGKDKYFEAFSKYFDLADEYLALARSGSPFDIDTDPNYGRIPLPVKLGISFFLPIIIAAIICSIWKKQMKTAVLAKSASNYIGPGGLALTNRADLFLYRTQTSRIIEEKSSSGGGGTSTRSSGSSGRSGKF